MESATRLNDLFVRKIHRTAANLSNREGVLVLELCARSILFVRHRVNAGQGANVQSAIQSVKVLLQNVFCAC